MTDPRIEYVSILLDITMTEFYVGFPRGYDDRPPLNLSRTIWLASHQSQKRYERDLLMIGRQ